MEEITVKVPKGLPGLYLIIPEIGQRRINNYNAKLKYNHAGNYLNGSSTFNNRIL